ncbi:response regulator [Variovorax sp. OV329]|uniref:response regulator n=1 Tax=Variovorax sp. OV329 TaxID=1882825 RepID=UPI0008F0855C|nr:response regulator [Variovorax sp. OV329]SFL93820.1 two-component system, cell cycle response regulator DivK [Variovorax sp. OV329]
MTTSGKTVLIVEDNEKNMKLARDVLQHQGHATLEARTGEEGLQLAVENRPDLILLDIQLPGMDGIALLQRLREHRSLDAVPVLAVSASVMPEDRTHIVSSGFDAYMTKPISLKPFLAEVERLLKEGRAP